MISFYKMSDKDMILLAAAVSLILAEGLTIDEQNTLGNFLMCVGQDIASAAAQKEFLEENEKKQSVKKTADS
jgi:hypothetical protein